MARLKNKIALITGGANGIGAATAQLFIQEGAKVIITDVCDEDGKKLAKKLGKKAHFHHLDVSCEKQWEALANHIKKDHKKLDILFNNAGISGLCPSFGPQDPEHASLTSWQAVHAINLNGVFLGCKYGIKLMKKSGGSIINMSSRSGLVGIPSMAAYASSKAAIRNHTKTVALYCAQKKYNIRCNSLHPAAILTNLWDPLLGATKKEQEASVKQVIAGIPLGRMGTALDVAYTALFLASQESSYITGAELTIDGGILAGATATPQSYKKSKK